MELSGLLLSWYDRHARTLPWRGIHDPYRTWVSETMLQQTRVETVLTYYERFLARFPNLAALAAAPEDEVMKLWEGLGYYRRAHHLLLGARQVMEAYGGVLPSDPAELRKIQGIGPYTAGAIASIAFDRPVPAVDGNVIRVVTRVMGVRENTGIPSVKRRIEALAASLVPERRPGDFNQAMMDLGATVCTPGTPNCDRCPLTALCDAYRVGDAEDIPDLPRKNPPRELTYDVCLIFSRGRVLMRQRTETMLQGLWIFPMTDGWRAPRQLPAAVRRKTGLSVREVEPAGEARHVFTHQIWRMRLYTMRTEAEDAPEGWRFVSALELDALALPTAIRKAAEIARQRLRETISPPCE